MIHSSDRARASLLCALVCVVPAAGLAQPSRGPERRLEERLTANPDDTRALCELGWIVARAGENERARRLLDRGIDLLVREGLPVDSAARRTRARRLGACLYSRGRVRAAMRDLRGASADYSRSLTYRDNRTTEAARGELRLAPAVPLAVLQASVVPEPVRQALSRCPLRASSWPAAGHDFPRDVVMVPAVGRAGRAYWFPGKCRSSDAGSVVVAERANGAQTIDVPELSGCCTARRELALISDGTWTAPAWLAREIYEDGHGSSCGAEHEEHGQVTVVTVGPEGTSSTPIGDESHESSECDGSEDGTHLEVFFHDATTIHVIEVSLASPEGEIVSERLVTLRPPIASSAPAPATNLPAPGGASASARPAYVSDVVIAFSRHAPFITGYALSRSGQLAVVGEVEGSFDFGGGVRSGGRRAFVASYGPDGRHRFDRTFDGCARGASEACGVDAVAVDAAGNVTVAGHYRDDVGLGRGARSSHGGTDVFVASYGADGSVRFTDDFGGAGDDRPAAITVARGGAIRVAARSTRPVDLGTGSTGGPASFVVSYAIDGTHQSVLPLAAGAQPTALTTDAAGNIVVAGTLASAANLGGGVRRPSAGSNFLASYDPRGHHRFDRTFGGRPPAAVATDQAGNVFVAGTSVADIDFGGGRREGYLGIYVVSYGPGGQYRFDRTFSGGGLAVSPQGLTADSSGNIVVTGSFGYAVDFGGGERRSRAHGDVFVASYGPDGRHRWDRTFARGNDPVPPVLAMTDTGDLLIAGRMSGATVDLGGGARVGDLFVVRLRD